MHVARISLLVLGAFATVPVLSAPINTSSDKLSLEEAGDLLVRDGTTDCPPTNPPSGSPDMTELHDVATQFAPFLRLMEYLLTNFQTNNNLTSNPSSIQTRGVAFSREGQTSNNPADTNSSSTNTSQPNGSDDLKTLFDLLALTSRDVDHLATRESNDSLEQLINLLDARDPDSSNGLRARHFHFFHFLKNAFRTATSMASSFGLRDTIPDQGDSDDDSLFSLLNSREEGSGGQTTDDEALESLLSALNAREPGVDQGSLSRRSWFSIFRGLSKLVSSVGSHGRGGGGRGRGGHSNGMGVSDIGSVGNVGFSGSSSGNGNGNSNSNSGHP
ncbi:hypothetical protein BGW80DRAFT_1459662 [Lactifluus volemus]|nr:hypothetical protein BGW80DRAFT_1459662 [Lactifluus volemus]